jgi:hypothetical protein
MIWLSEAPDGFGVVVVSEDNTIGQVRLRHIGEEVLQRLGIVREIKPAVGKMRQDHLDHEGLEAEAFTLLLDKPRPKLHQPHDLREILLIGYSALAGELEVVGDVRAQQRAVVLADKVAEPVRVARV